MPEYTSSPEFGSAGPALVHKHTAGAVDPAGFSPGLWVRQELSGEIDMLADVQML